jgi:hypothetical protein
MRFGDEVVPALGKLFKATRSAKSNSDNLCKLQRTIFLQQLIQVSHVALVHDRVLRIFLFTWMEEHWMNCCAHAPLHAKNDL